MRNTGERKSPLFQILAFYGLAGSSWPILSGRRFTAFHTVFCVHFFFFCRNVFRRSAAALRDAVISAASDLFCAAALKFSSAGSDL